MSREFLAAKAARAATGRGRRSSRSSSLQDSVGNRGVLAMMRALQAKRAVSTPGDRYEQEADGVAERVSTTEEPRGAHALSSSSAAPPSSVSSDLGGGRPLPDGERALLEPRLGHDLGGVRIHDDTRANEAARAAGAYAFTIGRDIVFAQGRYAPGSSDGRRLLAHELAHVVQQGASGGRTGAPVAGLSAGAVSPGSTLQRACDPALVTPHPLLIRGSVAPAVGEAQRKLNAADDAQRREGNDGFLPLPIDPDCVFGPKTEEGVVAFQKKVFPNATDWDGQIGDRTWDELDRASAGAPPPRGACTYFTQYENEHQVRGCSRTSIGGGIQYNITGVLPGGAACPDPEGKILQERLNVPTVSGFGCPAMPKPDEGGFPIGKGGALAAGTKTDTFQVCIPAEFMPPMCVYTLVQKMMVDDVHQETYVITFYVQRGNIFDPGSSPVSVDRRKTW